MSIDKGWYDNLKNFFEVNLEIECSFAFKGLCDRSCL